MYQIVMEYGDGLPAIMQQEVSIFADAAAVAIDLADLPVTLQGGGHGAPKWVKIYDVDRLQIALAVLPEGVAGPRVSGSC